MRKGRKRFLIWTVAILGLPLAWVLTVSGAVILGGKSNSEATGDAAIVLGAAVWDDEPSFVFAARIDHAILLFENGQVQYIIMTGGRSPEDSLSEGEAARRYAIDKGVPQEAILVESESTSTQENLANAQLIMVEQELSTAVIVSDPYHLRRAGIIAGRLGMDHVLSPTETTRFKGFGVASRQLFQEVYYVTKLLLIDR